MTAETGQFALILAMMVSAALAVIPLYGAWRRDSRLMAFAQPAALAQFLLIVLAFALLARAFLRSDFSLAVVAINSNSAMPAIYRFTAVWGNHEGSLLLWVLILSVFGMAVSLLGTNLPQTLRARVVAIQGMIATGFLALIVFTSNPFARMHPAPLDGQELNPLLQDMGLAIHPPFLYLGYVGFSIAYAFAIAALIEGKVDVAWARYVRPWVLAAWTFLTIGITLGSYWAYYELGWGGFWFWDPVENASFMPWLVGTALLHSALVVERRQALLVWTLLLAIFTFSLSLIGTFLVRSGVLTSVHAFASDPARGIGVLLLLVLGTGGGLSLFSLRAGSFRNRAVFGLVSREGGLVFNNIMLIAAAGTVFLGTFYPLIVEALGPDKISVGAPYFNRTFVPLMIPLLLAVAIGSFLRWKRDRLGRAIGKLRWPGLAALALTVAVGLTGRGAHLIAGLFLGLGLWLVLGSLAILASRMKLGKVAPARAWQLLRNTPRASFGMVLAHAGIGLAVIGITTTTAWDQERILAMAPGDSVALAGYEITLGKVELLNGPNYQAERGAFLVSRDGRPFTTITSERRFYPVAGRVTTEAGIRPVWLSNLYIAIGEANDGGKWVARLYYHPLVLLIWIGPLLMALGGLVSLSDRRLRIGVGQRRAAAPAIGMPAE